jgi:uncharacterized protein (TIGR02145 family)
MSPLTYPGAPTIGTATAGNSQATVTFTAPASDGGTPITNYTVTSSSTGATPTATGTSSPIIVTGLTNGASYTFTVTATNALGTSVASLASSPAVTPSSPFVCGNNTVAYGGGPYDITGTTRNNGGYYRTVAIGGQCWMKDNLNVGTYIVKTSNSNQTNDSIIEKFCYNNTESACDNSYGGFYQWHEAVALSQVCDSQNPSCSVSTPQQGICPTGWHIPTENEFYTLRSYLSVNGQGGSGTSAGSKMKASSGDSPTWDGTNSSGFDGIGSTYSDPNGQWATPSVSSVFWTSTWSMYWSGDNYSASPALSSGSATFDVGGSPNIDKFGFNVRCLKD